MSPKSDLMKAYGPHGHFSSVLYFAQRYDTPPSSMHLRLNCKRDSERKQKVLDLLRPAELGLEAFQHGWTIVRHADAEPDEDYVDNVYYHAAERGLLCEIGFYPDTLHLNFHYDAREAGLEDTLIDRIRALRAAFGSKKSPVFRVLTKEQGDFTTEKIDIDPFTVDLDRDYNDDLREVDTIIRESIQEQSSGLILLHGMPGTGKTSYIKSLLTNYPDQKFIFIPNEFVQAMLQPDFITFLISQKDSVLIIEDAEKVIMSRQSTGQNSVVSTILQITDGLFSDYLNIKVVCTFNTDVSKIDKALFRKGRMIAFYEFKELDEAKARAILGPGAELPERLTLAELYNVKERDFSGEVRPQRSIGFV